VAASAILSQPLFVKVIGAMAVDAALAGVAEDRAQMAGFAAGGGMLADQGIVGQIMIETHILKPGDFAMALVTLFSLFAVVRIVLLVATEAGGIDLLTVGAECMACLAGENVMRAVQREIGVGAVIELGMRPAPGDMATLAFVAVQSVVRIIVTMTAVAFPDLVIPVF